MAGPSSGAYAIINVQSMKALDVENKKGSSTGKETAGAYLIANATRNSRRDTQTWVLDSQSSGYQIMCSLTTKVIDVTSASPWWAVQYTDSNTTTQRWTIEPDGGTVTYNNQSYATYTIASKKWPTWYLAANNNAGSWVWITETVDNKAKWIFVPVPILSDGGTYEIVLSTDTTKCLEIASSSKSTSANCRSNSRTGAANQVFRAIVNSETGLTKLINVNSGLSLDIWTAKDNYNIAQWKVENTESQQWSIQKDGNIEVDGQTLPTYKVLTLKWNDQWCFTMDGTNLRCNGYTGASTQKFLFMKAEVKANDMAVPSALEPAVFQRIGTGKVYLKGLTFASTYSHFQVRYMVKMYKAGRKSTSKTAWKNWSTNAEAMSGWGTPWSSTFETDGKSTLINMPFNDQIQVVELTKTWVAADVIVEVRAYEANHGSGDNAHSDVKQTTLKVRQTPVLTVKTFSMQAENDSVSLGISLLDSLGEGCERFRARLMGEDGLIISDWVSVTTLDLSFVLGSTLYRLPNQNERITLEYQMLCVDQVSFNGSVVANISYTDSDPSFAVTTSTSSDGSHLVYISAPRHKSDCCVMEVSSLDGIKLIECKVFKENENGNRIWVGAPPLNTTSNIIVYSSDGDPSDVLYGTASIRIDSHCFIWNWGSSSDSAYSDFAILLVNGTEPPQQTRSFTTAIKFHSPSGRTLPVAFSGRSIDVDLSLAGTSVDEDANYYSIAPLPPHSTVTYITLLARLSGRGIHPIYRTPFGDWYQVGIESVDVSKNNLGYSDVQVKQRALED